MASDQGRISPAGILDSSTTALGERYGVGEWDGTVVVSATAIIHLLEVLNRLAHDKLRTIASINQANEHRRC